MVTRRERVCLCTSRPDTQVSDGRPYSSKHHRLLQLMKTSGQFNSQAVFTHCETTRNVHLIGNRAGSWAHLDSAAPRKIPYFSGTEPRLYSPTLSQISRLQYRIMKTVLLGSKLHCDHVNAPVILVDSGEYRTEGMYAGVKTSYVYPIAWRSVSTN